MLKSYYAANVESAVSRAKQELGPEAMLVQTRKAPSSCRHLGEYEVVFASDASPAEPARNAKQAALADLLAKVQPAAAGVTNGSRNGSPISEELAELRKQLERMTNMVTRSSRAALSRPATPQHLTKVFAALLEAEIDAPLAEDIVDRLQANGAAADDGNLERLVARELERQITVDARLGRGGDGPRIVALVGPPGSGKTTTLVKLAVQYGLQTRRPTQILSLDNYRIAAAEQLRTYAHILGVGFQTLETPRTLGQALEEHRHKDLILIDTPGYGAKELDHASELAQMFATHPAIDTHLVMPASMKPADLVRTAERYRIFKPRKLLFTKVDETESFGVILNEQVRGGLPVSFLTTGQEIPEDLEAATAARIVELLLGPQWLLATAAA